MKRRREKKEKEKKSKRRRFSPMREKSFLLRKGKGEKGGE